jgi:hypothetical protein
MCSYLYLKQAKMSSFSFFLLQNQRKGGQNKSCPWGRVLVVPVGGESGREGGRRGIWSKKCVHTYVNAKMIPVETIPGIGGRWIKKRGGGGGGKLSMIYLTHCKSLCKCHNVSHPAQQ